MGLGPRFCRRMGLREGPGLLGASLARFECEAILIPFRKEIHLLDQGLATSGWSLQSGPCDRP